MKIKPVNGYIVVAPYEKPTETVEGIIVAGNEQNSAPVRGTVIASSAKEYVEGAELFFRKYAIDELKFTNNSGEEQTVYVLDSREVLAEIISDNQEEHANEETKKRIETRELSQEHTKENKG